jgi:mannose-6-phosphate isomerase
LATILGKPLGPGDDYAESWEVVDHHQDQSVVLEGPVAGRTLHELVSQRADDLLGRHAGCESFPLLMKFLDANRTLSVQVHPTDAQAARLDPPDLGKTEAWVVLATEPGSKIYAGLKPGVTRTQLDRALEEGGCEGCLHTIEPAPGDCLLLPAGTVHALGAGLVIAEIQQASDTTFRLFDWNRKGADGRPRPLHIEQALATIDFTRGPIEPQRPHPTDQTGRERLVECDWFVLDRCTIRDSSMVGGDDRFHLLVVLEGALELAGVAAPLRAGHTLLLPAVAGTRELVTQARRAGEGRGGKGKAEGGMEKAERGKLPEAVVLDIYLP